MLKEVRVSGLSIDPITHTPIVLLKDKENQDVIPIWIGLLEASSIATQLEDIKLARPMTHDLMKNILSHLDAVVSRVEVNDLRNNTFFATIHLKWNGMDLAIDARPSDAIALALRMQAPIFVAEDVMKKAAVREKRSEGPTEEMPITDQLEGLNIELQKAVQDERYEDAAKIRDEIKNIKTNIQK